MTQIDAGDCENRPEPFRLGGVIGACLLALKAREASVAIVMEVARELPEIAADKCALKQIRINFLSNAIKLSNGGQMTVSAAVHGNRIARQHADIGVGESDLKAHRPRSWRHTVGMSRSRAGSAKGPAITVRVPIDCAKARAAATTLGRSRRDRRRRPARRHST